LNEKTENLEKPKKKRIKSGELVDGFGRKISQNEKKATSHTSDISMDIADNMLKTEENLVKKAAGKTLQTFSMILPKNEDGEFTKAAKEFARDGSAIAATAVVATGGVALPIMLGAIALKRLAKWTIKVAKESTENQVGEVSQKNMNKYGVNIKECKETQADMQAFEKYAVKYGIKYDLQAIDAPDSCTVKMDIATFEKMKTALEKNVDTPTNLLVQIGVPIEDLQNGTCEVEMTRKDLKFFNKQLHETYGSGKNYKKIESKIHVRKTPAVWRVRFQAKDAEVLQAALKEFGKAMDKQKNEQEKNPLNIKKVLNLFEFTAKHEPKKVKNKEVGPR